MTNTELFLHKLTQIEDELRKLGEECSELFEDFNGTDFPEQGVLAGGKLDNIILVATHETSSHINLTKSSIIDLTQFINFRRKYKQFSDLELEKAIDNDKFLVDFKSNLEKHNLIEKRHFLDSVKNLRTEWNLLFNDRSYSKLKKSFQT